MCGYAGYVSKTGRLPGNIAQALARLDDMLFHRGPDEGGSRVENGFAVVHRRLSIIDAAHGHQPMCADDGLLGVAYNGEIYNFRQLRAELEAEGTTFHTDCDTEVLLAMFERHGADCFRRLDGMFSAFIWDHRSDPAGEFYLVRDQLGVKPLYLYEDADTFAFSSELSPLLRIGGLDLSVDPIGLQNYLTFRYVVAPRTFFRHVRRVEAGSYVRIAAGRATTWRYWDVPVDEIGPDMSLAEAADELHSLLRASVAQQQMSEVPIGLLLSGGLDSSAIASLCADIGVSMTSFSIGFPELNEFAYAEEIAGKFGLPHVPVETTPVEILARFERVVSDMDEPIADPACFPLHILCDSIKSKVTVVLSGEGSDEMFAGYPQYVHALRADVASRDERFERFMELSWYFSGRPAPVKGRLDPSRNRLQKIYYDERPPLNGMLAFDQKTWLSENLMAKADKILMAHSLEGRFPFLSTKIVEFAAGLPDHFKLSEAGGKMVLRKAFESSLPASVLERRKMGFSVPVADLVQKMKQRLGDLLHSDGGIFAPYLDYESLRRDFDDHFSGRREQSLWLWTVLVLLQWQESLSKALLSGEAAAMRDGVAAFA